MAELAPELWSDFDGTAVVKKGKFNRHNWRKYPLPLIPGYVDFMRGIQSHDLQVAGIVSRRPDMSQRRRVTARSIAELGLDEFFASPEQIVLKGSEEAKGHFVLERSRKKPVALIDDRPDKFGTVVLDALSDPEAQTNEDGHTIVVGVVQHKRSWDRTMRLLQYARDLDNPSLRVEEFATRTNLVVGGIRLCTDQLDLKIIQLPEYSVKAGDSFACAVYQIAS